MSSINERIKTLLNKVYNGNVSEMARKCGIPQPTLNNILGERQSKPSFDNLEKIINSIELINIEWLMTGNGKMLKLEDSVKTSLPVDYKADSEKYRKLYEDAHEELIQFGRAFRELTVSHNALQDEYRMLVISHSKQEIDIARLNDESRPLSSGGVGEKNVKIG